MGYLNSKTLIRLYLATHLKEICEFSLRTSPMLSMFGWFLHFTMLLYFSKNRLVNVSANATQLL